MSRMRLIIGRVIRNSTLWHRMLSNGMEWNEYVRYVLGRQVGRQVKGHKKVSYLGESS